MGDGVRAGLTAFLVTIITTPLGMVLFVALYEYSREVAQRYQLTVELASPFLGLVLAFFGPLLSYPWSTGMSNIVASGGWLLGILSGAGGGVFLYAAVNRSIARGQMRQQQQALKADTRHFAYSHLVRPTPQTSQPVTSTPHKRKIAMTSQPSEPSQNKAKVEPIKPEILPAEAKLPLKADPPKQKKEAVPSAQEIATQVMRGQGTGIVEGFSALHQMRREAGMEEKMLEQVERKMNVRQRLAHGVADTVTAEDGVQEAQHRV